MFGIGGAELILILVFAFLILGPDKLPEMAKTAGKAIARFRDAQKDMNEVLKENDLVDARTGQPISNPVDMIDRVAKVAADGKGEEVVQKVTSAAAAAATSVIKPHESAEVDAGATPADAAVGAAPERAAAEDGQAKSMSFAERKARYERERAAREAAKAAAADEDATAEQLEEEPAVADAEAEPDPEADSEPQADWAAEPTAEAAAEPTAEAAAEPTAVEASDGGDA